MKGVLPVSVTGGFFQHDRQLRGELPAFTTVGWSAWRFMKLGCQEAGTRRRLLALHSSRQDLEPSVRKELIGYVGFAASISAAPPAAVGRWRVYVKSIALP